MQQNINTYMRKKLTNDEIDKRLKESNRDIVRIDNYPGKNSIKIKWKCLLDEHIWEASTANILNNKGCPKCSGNLPISNEEIDMRLDGRKIQRLSNYPGKVSIKMKWKCLLDEHTWEATANDICYGKGCPKCAENIKLTNEEIDKRLQSRSIVRISEYPGRNNIKMKWKCLIDGDEWWAPATNIFYKKCPSGCPKCKRKSEHRVEEIIKEMNVVYIKQYNLFDRYKVDFFIPSKNIVVEYNGEQHYKVVNFCGDMNRSEQKFIKQKHLS